MAMPAIAMNATPSAMSEFLTLDGVLYPTTERENTTENAHASIASIGTYQMMAMTALEPDIRQLSKIVPWTTGIWVAAPAASSRETIHPGRRRPIATAQRTTAGHITAPPAPSPTKVRKLKRHQPTPPERRRLRAAAMEPKAIAAANKMNTVPLQLNSGDSLMKRIHARMIAPQTNPAPTPTAKVRGHVARKAGNDSGVLGAAGASALPACSETSATG